MSFTVEYPGGRHPVAELLATVDAAVREATEAPLWSPSDGELAGWIEATARAQRQLAAIMVGLVAEVDGRGLAGRAGASSTQAWLRHRLHCTPQEAAGQVRLARAMPGLPETWQALVDGRVSVRHAQVIADAVADLPDRPFDAECEATDGTDDAETVTATDAADMGADVGEISGAGGAAGPAGGGETGGAVADAAGAGGAVASAAGAGRAGEVGTGDGSCWAARVDGSGRLRRRAEAHLIAQCQHFDPRQVARLGRRILEVVDPQAADAAEAEKLAALERRAWRRRDLSFTPDGHGTVHVRGRFDTESAAIIRRALDPLAKPRPSGPDLPDLRAPGARLADAWVELSRRHLATGNLPAQKGERPQVVVTIDHDILRDQSGVGVLDSGEQLSPGAVRRLACDAGILPAVLGSGGAVLDLGRTERLFTTAQRRALTLRDRGCAFPGCDRPPAWCEAHHITHWIDGGATDLHNAVLLCGFHHRGIHKGHWIVRIADDEQPEFTPPRYIDPAQTPIRNHRPQPGRRRRQPRIRPPDARRQPAPT